MPDASAIRVSPRLVEKASSTAIRLRFSDDAALFLEDQIRRQGFVVRAEDHLAQVAVGIAGLIRLTGPGSEFEEGDQLGEGPQQLDRHRRE
ncbi:hypothetical protein [Nocardia sp. NPDC005366]|uniref:hypothetical protein n=1 Tax=Nocardia sp. NPDC005366 TaxID=3156878 RepID=UPI00339E25E9